MEFEIKSVKLSYLALLCIAFCFTCGAHDRPLMLLEPQHVQKLLEQAEICFENVKHPLSALKQIFKWPISDSRFTKTIYQCVCSNVGYTDKDGHMVIEKFMTLKLLNGTKEEVTNLLRECNKITLEDPQETAYAMGACLHKSCAFAIKNEETGQLNILFQPSTLV